MDENQIGFASNIYSLLRLQQQELRQLREENDELLSRVNRLEEWLARVEAGMKGDQNG